MKVLCHHRPRLRLRLRACRVEGSTVDQTCNSCSENTDLRHSTLNFGVGIGVGIGIAIDIETDADPERFHASPSAPKTSEDVPCPAYRRRALNNRLPNIVVEVKIRMTATGTRMPDRSQAREGIHRPHIPVPGSLFSRGSRPETCPARRTYRRGMEMARWVNRTNSWRYPYWSEPKPC